MGLILLGMGVKFFEYKILNTPIPLNKIVGEFKNIANLFVGIYLYVLHSHF
jgi:hypothetical protein